MLSKAFIKHSPHLANMEYIEQIETKRKIIIAGHTLLLLRFILANYSYIFKVVKFTSLQITYHSTQM